MGRPRQFSREGVIDAALPVFWAQGYARTSLHDLEQATGVNKSGLYAEFEGKEDLFLSCLRRYYETRRGRAILARMPQGWDNIREYLDLGRSRLDGQGGCFAVNSMRELGGLPPEASEIVTENRRHVKALILQNVEAERPGIEAPEIADTISAFFSGLCIEFNLYEDPQIRRRAIDGFMALLRRA
ncbi:MAG: TetR/AcrR family transcriptional regulator [Janthinobacterium lividum]